jgi:hypothetical protein
MRVVSFEMLYYACAAEQRLKLLHAQLCKISVISNCRTRTGNEVTNPSQVCDLAAMTRA